MLLPTVSRPVCLGTKHPAGAYDQIFIPVRVLRDCSCGALSLTRGRVCLLCMLLSLASAVMLRSQYLGTRDHILLSQIGDFPLRSLLRLAGLRWRYSTPPPYKILCLGSLSRPELVSRQPEIEHLLEEFSFRIPSNSLLMYALSEEHVYACYLGIDLITGICCNENMVTEPLPSNDRIF
jgi:hypothetical protein